MDLDAKVDIQPGPAGLHETLVKVDLASVKINGNTQPLVPPDVPEKSVEAANQALQAIAEVIIGDVTATGDDTQYIYPSTSLHVARARSGGTGKKQVGRLHGKSHAPFVIGFEGELTFSRISKTALARRKKARSELQSVFNDVGDFFSDVSNGVIALTDAVVDGVVASIEFVVDGVSKAWDLTLEYLSEAAELAVAVLDAIKVAFQGVFDWLAFVFDWDDMALTATIFEGMLNDGANAFRNNIGGYITAINSALGSARGQINDVFSKAETQLGTETPGAPTAKNSLTIARPSILVGKLPTEDEKSVEMSGGDFVDTLGSSASWLLQKFEDPLGSLAIPDGAAAGLEEFFAAVEKIISSTMSEQTQSDFSNATGALNTLLSTITSQGVFSDTTLAAFLKAVQQLAFVAVDLIQDLVSALGQLLQCAVDTAVAALQTPITNPAISWIYGNIMNGAQCTLGGACALALAVPYTLLYKGIAGQAPFQGAHSLKDADVSIFSEVKAYMTGITKIVIAIYSVADEAIEMVAKGTLFGDTTRFLSNIVLCASFSSVASTSPLTTAKPRLAVWDSPVTSVENSLIAIEAFSSGVNGLKLILNNTSMITNKAWLKPAKVAIQGTLGITSVGLYAYLLSVSTETNRDKLLSIAGVVDGVRNGLMFTQLTEFIPPPVRIGIIIFRFAAGITAGSIIIQAAPMTTVLANKGLGKSNGSSHAVETSDCSREDSETRPLAAKGVIEPATKVEIEGLGANSTVVTVNDTTV